LVFSGLRLLVLIPEVEVAASFAGDGPRRDRDDRKREFCDVHLSIGEVIADDFVAALIRRWVEIILGCAA